MSRNDTSILKGYESQYQETRIENLQVTGEIPNWLSGNFISNGPAQFEVGKIQFRHWFDGFAMLKKFTFQSGKVNFENKFLRSKEYNFSNQQGYLSQNAFATYAKNTIFGKIKFAVQNLIHGVYDDNCNVNITRMADQFIAMTESSQLLAFDTDHLNTLGAFTFSDTIQNQMSTAHPHWDSDTREIINVAIEIGKINKYHVYKMQPHSDTREIIATYVSDRLFYMHSFSITPDYVVLFKSPLTIHGLKLLFGFPFNETLFWAKNKTAFFVVIERKTGKILEIEADPFICLHSVNAYQVGNEIILDLICHSEGNPYNDLYFANIRAESPGFPAGILRRYVLDLNLKKSRYTACFSKNYEFPRLHYNLVNGKNYRFFYASFVREKSVLPCAIEKFDLDAGSVQRWHAEHCYPGEPVFVPKPNASQEDAGVLLSIVFNSVAQTSSLVVLDAMNLQQLAEIALPFHLPFGLHGGFY